MLGESEAEAMRTEARSRLDALGLAAMGWETAFRLAATGGRELTTRDTTSVA